jgi:hypothetical protein
MTARTFRERASYLVNRIRPIATPRNTFCGLYTTLPLSILHLGRTIFILARGLRTVNQDRSNLSVHNSRLFVPQSPNAATSNKLYPNMGSKLQNFRERKFGKKAGMNSPVAQSSSPLKFSPKKFSPSKVSKVNKHNVFNSPFNSPRSPLSPRKKLRGLSYSPISPKIKVAALKSFQLSSNTSEALGALLGNPIKFAPASETITREESRLNVEINKKLVSHCLALSIICIPIHLGRNRGLADGR